MVRVQPAYGYNLHSRAQYGIAVELLLQPELLQRHFAAAFNLALVLTAFFFLYLNGTLRAAVLKLYLRAHAPAVTEVVAHVNHHVRQVELTVMVTRVLLGILAVTQVVVRVETVFGCHLAVTAYSELPPPLRFRLLALNSRPHFLG